MYYLSYFIHVKSSPKTQKNQLNFPIKTRFGIGTACLYASVLNSTQLHTPVI